MHLQEVILTITRVNLQGAGASSAGGPVFVAVPEPHRTLKLEWKLSSMSSKAEITKINISGYQVIYPPPLCCPAQDQVKTCIAKQTLLRMICSTVYNAHV